MSSDTLLFNLPPELVELSPEILQQAFTHRSMRARSLKKEETNERLEYLGDAVLELIISQYLFNKYPKADEGRLTRYRSALVKTESLAAVAQDLNLGANLQTNLADSSSEYPSLLADTFEAVLGALYQEKGYSACREFVEKYLLPHQQDFIDSFEAKDPKSMLQEILQSQGLEAPQYEIIAEEGPDHAKTFTIEVKIQNYEPVTGQGSSKQRAQQAAAQAILRNYFPDIE